MCQDLKYESRLLNEVGSTGDIARRTAASAPPSPQFKVGGKGIYVKLRDCPCKPNLSAVAWFLTLPRIEPAMQNALVETPQFLR